MHESLMDILAEPRTGAALKLEVTRHQGEQIEEGVLTSEASGASYTVTNGIPRFTEHDYAESFGLQWNKFRAVQLDSNNGTHISSRRLWSETGWNEEQIKDRWVLDAGCGAGRFAEIAAAAGAKIVALDLSSAVDAAAQTLAKYPQAHIVQGSLLSPPFRSQVFDFAYCIGVVQHTPDRCQAITSVVRCVKPSGRFAFSIYGRRPWTKLNAKYLLRPITRRLPQSTLLSAITKAMPVIFPLTDTLFGLPGISRVARFVLPVASYPELAELSRQQRCDLAVLDTFDMLSPRYDEPMTWREVDEVLRNCASGSWTFFHKRPVVVSGSC